MTDFTERVLQARSRFDAMCAEPVSLDITRGKTFRRTARPLARPADGAGT